MQTNINPTYPKPPANVLQRAAASAASPGGPVASSGDTVTLSSTAQNELNGPSEGPKNSESGEHLRRMMSDISDITYQSVNRGNKPVLY